MKQVPYIILFALTLMGMVACDDYDSWTSDPKSQLTFSEDTVNFDTIITKQSSTTKTLIVFNHNDAGLRINRVALGQGSSSHFRINVDGQYLASGEGEDFEVRRKDSIYVRAEVELPEGDGNSITHYEDRLTFTLESGVTQSVTLVADGIDVYIVPGLEIKNDTTIQSDRPLVFRDSLVIDSGATVTIVPGTTLMFHEDVALQVHGTLKAEGTLEEPIIFRGDRIDNMFDYLPYDNTPNRWAGIHFYGESRDNVLYQCDIHSGDYGILCDSTHIYDLDHPTLVLENSIIHNVGGNGLELNNCISKVIGCQISNALGKCVTILGGAHDFVHCTIAQFYPFSANRSDALYLSNMNGETYCPLYWAHFLNCVVTGYADDVVMGNISEGTDYTCDYLFANSLLRTVKSDDEARFVNITYDNSDLDPNGEKHFVLFDTTNFLYDFTPDSASAIRGLADMEYTKLYSPVDRRGVDRMADGAPDAGCYEYVAK